ncbi:hypothetical protein [Methylomicrobium sp. Wu6]|uniref:hypothetical protein n=1 Tax=Methylomicrobium sp. Wu6 TaxID=3107928 RepID=UPI002DD68717|nr:hypothetical protein [Methylomicrobium sp. Wu6]MEC4747525.1 hypothetical protein [Methylomicrobium sp. Wu6]
MTKYLLLLWLMPLPLYAMEIPGPEGVSIEVSDDAPHHFIRLLAIGESDLLIGDRKDVQRATKIATLKAKAAIARYLGEAVKTEEVVEQISESAQQSYGKTAIVSRHDAEKLVETIRNSSAEFMKGIIVLEQNVDQAAKRVIVTVGTDHKTQRTADLVKEAFTRNSGYRPLLSTLDGEEIQSEPVAQEIRRSKHYDEFF